MNSCRRSLLVLCLVCAASMTPDSRGQSLALVRRPEGEFWIEAATPPGTQYVLQASENLRLWVDLTSERQGEFSHRLDGMGASMRFFRLAEYMGPPEPVTIVLIGDSTVADKAINFNVFNGWGQGFHDYFRTDARIVNLAIPGHSSENFLTSEERSTMVVLKPDYVLVQFGLIDEFGELETQKTTIPEYTENLRTIVQIVREFDGTPILVTPPVQRYFDARDKVIRVYPDRRAAILSLAAELGTWVIDLNQLTAELFDRLGSEGGAYIWYADNYLHFSDEGARVIAGLVVRALPASLGPYLVNVFD